MNTEELFELKENIDEAKNEVNQLEGRKQSLLETLKDEWDCTSIKQAKKKLKDMNDKIQEIDQKIMNGIEELEEKYEFE